MQKEKIMLIEDDLELQKLIQEYLENYDYLCEAFSKPKEAIAEYTKNSKEYTLIILDLGLPEMDGFDVMQNIKKICNVPIIISTARGDIGNKIYGFELGADDYLAKPYEPRELILRINLVLKRLQQGSFYQIGDFEINKKTKQVFFNENEVSFTPVEYEIFILLTNNKNQGITREQIIQATSLKENTKDRTVDTHIRNIRSKIYHGDKYIKSVWGIGYRFTC